MNSNKSTSRSDARIAISNFLLHIDKKKIIKTILDGLTSDRKYISSKYFYDEIGSKLFEKITLLPEYYLTRTEKNILRDASFQIAGELRDIDIIELGSGDSSKISILLGSIPTEHIDSVCYIPVDVNQSVMEDSAKLLIKKFPGIKVHGVVADFETQLDLIPGGAKRLVCFFGSTIGNLSRKESLNFFSDLGKAMQLDDMILLGVDMVKSKDVLDKAYNDSKNVTAEFNRNILNAVNNLVGTDFDQENFSHIAFYDEEHSRIEMHLKAKRDMEILCPYLSERIIINEGETIHTENSHKFTDEHIDSLALAGGLDIKNIFIDENKWFSLVQFLKKE
ncbi:MAG: L-histidine N(alpha)-methyltransferase [Candidatus Aminicenantes bacterium]|nr:L-histidine N(alpha)-methyltransferase [Candidatus Aminicenantes bacterium]